MKAEKLVYKCSFVEYATICVILEYTKISEVNLYAFIYRLFHEDFSSDVPIIE